jgi:biopolymer transport protein ExbB/TolQ
MTLMALIIAVLALIVASTALTFAWIFSRPSEDQEEREEWPS